MVGIAGARFAINLRPRWVYVWRFGYTDDEMWSLGTVERWIRIESKCICACGLSPIPRTESSADETPDEIRTESGADETPDETFEDWDEGSGGEGGSGEDERNRSRFTFAESERLVVKVWEVVGSLFQFWRTESESKERESTGDSGFQRGPKTLSDFENPLPDSESEKEEPGEAL